MTNNEFIKFIQEFWLQFLLTAVSGLLAWKCKDLYKKNKEAKLAAKKLEEEKALLNKHEEERIANEARLEREAILSMLHDRLTQALIYFLRVKKISTAEHSNVEGMFSTYEKLGGNGTVHDLHVSFKKHVDIVPVNYLTNDGEESDEDSKEIYG